MEHSIVYNIEVVGTRKGLYCAETGKWIKWLGKDEYNKLRFRNDVKVHT